MTVVPDASRRTAAFALLVAVTAAVFIAVPAWQLLGPGPFDWAIAQPFAWQGGLEALLLLVLVALGCRLARRWALLALVAVPLAFYLRRHEVDVPLAIDLLYLEIVIGLGALVRRLLRLPAPGDVRDYLHAFVAGLLLWSLVAWSLCALDAGTIKTLRWLTLALALPAACAGHAPLVLHLWRRLRVQDATGRLWCGALAAWIAVLYARSNVVFGYDSLWYGLRPEYVLDPAGSVFEPLGLVAPVHYYPKLYEVFLLPVCALGDNSVIVGMTIGMLVLGVLACDVLAHRIGLPARARMPALALVATLPALANSALGSKPDVISVLFVLIAADAALGWLRSRAAADGAWMLVAGMLACLAKLTAIPYVGALVLAAAIAVCRRDLGAAIVRVADPRATRLAFACLLATLAVSAFVIARTWLLAGVPTILQADAWKVFGLTLAAPAGTLPWARAPDWGDVPALVVDWLFRPQRLMHVVTEWVGNVWAWCALLALAAALCGCAAPRSAGSRVPLFALIATGVVLGVAVGYPERGSDGNYFLAALLPAILVAASAAFTRLATMPRVFVVALACLPAFALFQASYAFLSAGWSAGTRTFDFDLARDWHDTRLLRWKNLEQAGLAGIGKYLREAPGRPRAVGYAQEPASFWLPARFESLVAVGYWRPEYVDDAQRFLQFLREQRIDYLVLPHDDAQQRSVQQQSVLVTPAVDDAASLLQADPAVRRIRDRDYDLLDLSALHARERRSGARTLRADARAAG